MSVNLSSFNASLSSVSLPYFICLDSPLGSKVYTVYSITNIVLILPLSVFIVYTGFQRWRFQRGGAPTVRPTSHADLFTYHLVVKEIFGMFGCGIYCVASSSRNLWLMMIGFYMFSVILPAHAAYHCLICAERYLAVVHPIMYLSLRKSGGVRITNICIGLIWCLTFGWFGVMKLYSPNFPTAPFFFLSVLSLCVTCFCSLSVLCALIRPAPGEVGRDRKRVNKSKLRAFRTIVIILGVLLLRFIGLIVCFFVYKFISAHGGDGCEVLMFGFWLTFPSSLALPLNFLHRSKKVPCSHC